MKAIHPKYLPITPMKIAIPGWLLWLTHRELGMPGWVAGAAWTLYGLWAVLAVVVMAKQVYHEPKDV